ncbi:uncharacterized protein LOC135367566 [Ornithodoros turicata]|uniref:uncharacterized protein LOC135367566 n=1 Tax=Ornithodoros turicata TaxID=34597 RepID=UPI003138FBF0
MGQNIDDVVAAIEDFIAVSQPNYNWSKLSETMDTVLKAWTSMQRTKRISHAAKLLQIASTYITPQRPKYWNDVQAVFYIADQVARLLNQQMEQILKKGQVLVSHLGLEIPSLTSVSHNILNFVPDAINIALEVVKTELGPVIEKLTDKNLKTIYAPCHKGLFADFLSVRKKQPLIDFEKNLCRSIPALTSEFLVEPHLAAIMTMLQVVNSGQAVSFNWISAGSNLIKLTRNADHMSKFNGAVFPDVPALSSSALDDALNNVRAALGLPGSTHSSVLLQGFKVVRHIFNELDRNLNDSLSAYLVNVEPFIAHAKEALSLSNGSHPKVIEELFASEPDVAPLVHWVETYLMKFIHLLLHTLMHDPVKMAIFNNSADIMSVACNYPVDDYFLLSPDDLDIARTAIKHLCAINMSSVIKWAQERNDSSSVGRQLDSETFFESVADVVSSMYGAEDTPPFANISVWRQLIEECLGHDRNERRTKLESLMKGAATLMHKERFSSLDNALHLTACKAKYSLRNLKWDFLMEAWSGQPNVIAILKAINGSVDILNAVIDTVCEPDLVKTIVLEIATDLNGRKKFCSMKVSKWNKYFALKDEDISLLAKHVRHLVCDFDYKALTEELKSICLTRPMLRRDTASSQLVDDTMTVLDHIDHAFPSSTDKMPPFLDAKYWKDTVIAFWNLLKNGLVKMDLTELNSWLSLLDSQISSKKSRQEFSLAVHGARTAAFEMLRGFQGEYWAGSRISNNSSDLPEM